MEELLRKGKMFSIFYNPETKKYIVISEEMGIREEFLHRKKCKQFFDLMESKYSI